MGALAPASHCALRRGRVGMRVVVPIARLDRPTIRALGYAHSIAAHVSVVHITNDDAGAERIRRSWSRPPSQRYVIVTPSPRWIVPATPPGPPDDDPDPPPDELSTPSAGNHHGPPEVATPFPKHSTVGREKSA